MFRSKRLILIALSVVLAVVAGPALAHGYIVRAIPADRAVLERPPTRVQYWFSEDLEPGFSTLNIRDQSGAVIATGGVSEDDRSLMAARLPSGLPDGAYIVELRPAFASDGHAVAESRVFFVGEEVGGVAGAAASDQAVPLEVVWRALVTASLALLLGVYTLYALVLVPAWGSSQYKAGLLPPRVMRRLSAGILAALAVAFAGQILALLQQAMVFFNASLPQVIEQNLWEVVRIGSRFGDVWNIRLLLLGAVATIHIGTIYFRDEQPEIVRALWTGNAWLMALIIGASSITSHAAGSLLWPWLAMGVSWLHTVAVALWVGGAAALVLALPVALRPYQGEARRLALLAVMRRFSRLATALIVVVVATGLYNALNWFYTPADVPGTTYGRALLLKLLLAGLLLLMGALHHIALRPDLAKRVARLFSPRVFDLVGRFGVTLRLEVVFAILTLIAAGLLSATPIPTPEFAQQPETPAQTQEAGEYAVTMTVAPGGPGINTYDLVILEDGVPRDDLEVVLQMVNPSRDWRGPLEKAEQVDSGVYVTAGDEINRAGQWWALVDIHDAEAQQRVAFEWTVTDAAAVIDSRDPSWLNRVALVAVAGAALWAVWPALRGYARRLDWSPLAVSVAVGVTVMTIALVVLGFRFLEDTQRRYEETLFPAPQVVNSVLPDAASLTRGEALYLEHCIAWQSASADYRALRNGLESARDDLLYRVTVEGWRSLPPCAGDLTDAQRWDIVNYFRTLGR